MTIDDLLALTDRALESIEPPHSRTPAEFLRWRRVLGPREIRLLLVGHQQLRFARMDGADAESKRLALEAFEAVEEMIAGLGAPPPMKEDKR